MLTCSQIIDRLQAIRTDALNSNFCLWATRIHPECDWLPPYSPHQITQSPQLQAIFHALDDLPEVAEAERSLNFHTPDFTDLALHKVALWQANAAKTRWWTDNVVNQPNAAPPPNDECHHQFDHQAIARFIKLSRRRKFRLVQNHPKARPARIIGTDPVISPPSCTELAPADKYHLTISLARRNGAILCAHTLHTNGKHTILEAYTKLSAALADDLWKFDIDYEAALSGRATQSQTDDSTEATTSREPTGRESLAEVNANSLEDLTHPMPDGPSTQIPF